MKRVLLVVVMLLVGTVALAKETKVPVKSAKINGIAVKVGQRSDAIQDRWHLRGKKDIQDNQVAE